MIKMSVCDVSRNKCKSKNIFNTSEYFHKTYKLFCWFILVVLTNAAMVVAILIAFSLKYTRSPSPNWIRYCAHSVCGFHYGIKMALLLVYHSLCCIAKSLSELIEFLTILALETQRLIMLNLHVDDEFSEAAQDFVAIMTTMGLSQIGTGSTQTAGHT